MKKVGYIIIGWLCVVLAVLGVLLPLLPTTPFLILASACFAKSSERFHQMLLNNSWFGHELKLWEQSKTISRHTKKKTTVVIVLTFAISIAVLHPRLALQLMLVAIACLLLFFIWRIKERL